MKKIRFLILAAGRGSRMLDLTSNRPKCLVEIGGKSILNWQRIAIKKSGIKIIQIITGYLSEMIPDNYEKVKNNIWNETNMVYSLFCSKNFNGDTIISYSDILYHSSYIKNLMESKHDITILADLKWKNLWDLRMENPLEDAETFKTENNFLKSIGDKTDSYKNIQAQYMGLMKFTKKGMNTLKKYYYLLDNDKQKTIDMTSMLMVLLENKIKIYVYFVNGKWIEADSNEDVLIYNQKLTKDDGWIHDWR